MREKDPRFADLERRVGIFLLASVVIVIGVIVLVGVRQGLFTPMATITFHDDSGRDLAEGLEVFTRGFRIGKVKRLRLDDAGRVEVALAIDKSLLRWIREDSTARIVAKALIGDSQIEISPGTPQASPMLPGGRIAFKRDPDLADIAKQVMADVKSVLQAVDSLVSSLDRPGGDLKQTIANANRFADGLIETRARLDETIVAVGARVNTLTDSVEALAASLRSETLPKVAEILGKGTGAVEDAGRTIRSLDTLVQKDLHGIAASLQTELIPQMRALIASVDRTASAADGSLTQVNRDLPALLAKVDASLENIRLITENLVPAAKEATGVLRQGGELVDDSQSLVRRTGELWPFAAGRKKPGTTIDVDSYQIRNAPDPGPVAGPRAR